METCLGNFGFRRQYDIDGVDLPRPLGIPALGSMVMVSKEDCTRFIIGYKLYVGKFNYFAQNCGLKIGEPQSVGSLLMSSGLKSEDERRVFARRELGFEYDGQFPWDRMGRWVYGNSYFEELETFSPSEENLYGQIIGFFRFSFGYIVESKYGVGTTANVCFSGYFN